MSDEIWKRDAVESPCVKLCTIHTAARICVGCLRSIDEITGWAKFTPQERREIMASLPQRAPLIAKRRGGRARRKQST